MAARVQLAVNRGKDLLAADSPPAGFLQRVKPAAPDMAAHLIGTWNLVSNVNSEGYMVALGIDFATRKIASRLKPQKVIKQEGDVFTIQTFTTFRNYQCSFKVGEEFQDVTKGIDNRTCQSVVNWVNDKLVCVQRGEKKNRGWTHWIEGDELHLELTCEDQVCKQVYKKAL